MLYQSVIELVGPSQAVQIFGVKLVGLTAARLDLSVRFVTRERGVREVKDALSRELLAELHAAGIPLASTTFELIGIPPLRLKVEPGSGTRTAEGG
jgi:hypothetical protein